CETAHDLLITLHSRLPRSIHSHLGTFRLNEFSRRPHLTPAVDFPDLPDPALIRTFPSFGGRLFYTSFSPDGTKIISAGDNAVKLWDVKTGALLRSWDFRERTLSSAVFSPSGELIAVGGDDGLSLYDVYSGAAIRSFDTFEDATAKNPRGIV